MSKIRKAIIPAAGYGTRFLPATKAMPKEMLSVVDKPTIQYIVYEDVQASVVAVEFVPWKDVSKFGVIDGEEVSPTLYKIHSLIEKPQQAPPSNLAIMGRYILQPQIFKLLEQMTGL